MTDATWSEADPSVIHFAENLIDEFHPILKSARIAFVFRDKAQKSGERFILGDTSKVPSKMQPYLEYDFLIWVSEEDWVGMDDLLREALIDHLLCHCTFGASGWKIRPHDIQDFADVIARHGVYSPDAQAAKSAVDKWQTETLPGLLMNGLEKAMGKVESLKGAQIEITSGVVAEE